MTADRRVFRGRVLTPAGEARRQVTVEDGVVTAVEQLGMRPEPGIEVVELAADEVLLPGVVDTHVHVNEPGRTEWEGFATATAAAEAGGVTTILDMPLNSIPATTSVAALRTKRAAAEGQCAVDVGFWGGAVPESLGQLEALHEAGVFGFKCFLLDSGVPEFPPLSADQLRRAMTEIAAFDGLLIVHAEDPDVIQAHAGAGSRSAQQGGTTPLGPPAMRSAEQGGTTPLGPPAMRKYTDFLASRPPAAETKAIDTVIAAARVTGCRTHLVHLSSADALPAIAAARADGVRLTVETCPHYLILHAEDIADGQTQFKCCPPVRDAANSDRLWRALEDGVIDVVVSDHSPCTAELKRLDVGDFGLAWGGISSIQLGLPLVWTEARARGHSLARVVAWLAAGPADLVGLSGKGRIAVGSAADFVVFAPDESFTVDVGTLRHKNPVTPYAGRTLHGVVRQTYLRGVRIATGERPRGRLLNRT